MNRQRFLSEEIKIPDCVREKADSALAMIQDGRVKQESRKAKYAFYHMKGFAAGVAACAALVITVSAGAAAYHHMSQGAEDILQAEQSKMDQLAESGLVTLFDEQETAAHREEGVEKVGEQRLQGTENLGKYAVTDAGITITPEECICDGRFTYITFAVEGYDPGNGMEPCFERYDLTVEGTNGPLTVSDNCFFDDGIVTSPDGLPVYRDGSAMESDGEGHYVSEDGSLQYIVWFYSMDGDNLIGTTAHLSLNNLGTIYKADYTNSISGEWTVSVPIEGNETEVTYRAYERLGESGFTVTGFSVSPISIEVDYEVDAVLPKNIHHTNGVPDFRGVRLSDGTELRYLADGGLTGYEDEARTQAYAKMSFDRVIDPTQITALYFCSFAEDGEMIEYTVEFE